MCTVFSLVRMEPSKTNRMTPVTPQQFHIIPTSCAIFINYALCLLVVCIAESIGVGSAGCGVHVDVLIMSPMGRVQHKLGSELCCGWLQLANFVQSLFSGIFCLHY